MAEGVVGSENSLDSGPRACEHTRVRETSMTQSSKKHRFNLVVATSGPMNTKFIQDKLMEAISKDQTLQGLLLSQQTRLTVKRE